MMQHLYKQLKVPAEHHNQRIDTVVAQLFPAYSRSQISNWIKSGAITKNHKPCKPKDKVLDEDLIEIQVDFTTEAMDFNQCQPENIPLQIIFEDDDILIINKQAGLVVHPGAGNKEHTLVNALLHHAPHLKQVPRAGIIHRLDKDTTGLLIIAKTLAARTTLVKYLQAREIDRHYLALVQGNVIAGGTIDTGFGRHPRNRLKMAVTGQERQAITHYKVDTRYKNFTLLQVSLMTGRTHQIRVHMAHIHHPVIGDPLYGGGLRIPASASDSLRTAVAQFKRQALHAYELTFLHPSSHKELTFKAPLPDDFTLLLYILGKENEY